MSLRDDCVMLAVADVDMASPWDGDVAAVGKAVGCSSISILNVLDHAHRAGEECETSLVVATGPGLADRAEALAAAVAETGRLRVLGSPARIFRQLASFDASLDLGQYVVAVCVDFTPTVTDAAQQEREFDEWYSYEHMGDVSRAAGIHRAFRVEAQDDQPRRYWCLYECDSPEVFMDSRRGKAPWGGLWAENIKPDTFRRSYFEIIGRWAPDLVSSGAHR